MEYQADFVQHYEDFIKKNFELIEIVESQNHYGWNRPSRSSGQGHLSIYLENLAKQRVKRRDYEVGSKQFPHRIFGKCQKDVF